MKTLLVWLTFCGLVSAQAPPLVPKGPMVWRSIDGETNLVGGENWFQFSGSVAEVLEAGYLVRGNLFNEKWDVVDGFRDEKKIYLLKNFRRGLVDDDYIKGELVKLVGQTDYRTVLGAKNTIRVIDYGIPYWPPAPPLTEYQLLLQAQAKKAKEEEKKAASARLLKWQMEQATNGAAHAQCSLGLRYLKGDGVPEDAKLARLWLQKASTQGDSQATAALSKMAPALTHSPTKDPTSP